MKTMLWDGAQWVRAGTVWPPRSGPPKAFLFVPHAPSPTDPPGMPTAAAALAANGFEADDGTGVWMPVMPYSIDAKRFGGGEFTDPSWAPGHDGLGALLPGAKPWFTGQSGVDPVGLPPDLLLHLNEDALPGKPLNGAAFTSAVGGPGDVRMHVTLTDHNGLPGHTALELRIWDPVSKTPGAVVAKFGVEQWQDCGGAMQGTRVPWLGKPPATTTKPAAYAAKPYTVAAPAAVVRLPQPGTPSQQHAGFQADFAHMGYNAGTASNRADGLLAQIKAFVIDPGQTTWDYEKGLTTALATAFKTWIRTNMQPSSTATAAQKTQTTQIRTAWLDWIDAAVKWGNDMRARQATHDAALATWTKNKAAWDASEKAKVDAANAARTKWDADNTAYQATVTARNAAIGMLPASTTTSETTTAGFCGTRDFHLVAPDVPPGTYVVVGEYVAQDGSTAEFDPLAITVGAGATVARPPAIINPPSTKPPGSTKPPTTPAVKPIATTRPPVVAPPRPADLRMSAPLSARVFTTRQVFRTSNGQPYNTTATGGIQQGEYGGIRRATFLRLVASSLPPVPKGATVQSITLRLYRVRGGVNAPIDLTVQATGAVPGSNLSAATGASIGNAVTVKAAMGAYVDVTFTGSAVLRAYERGQIRGFIIGGASVGTGDYANFEGPKSQHPPLLNVNYV